MEVEVFQYHNYYLRARLNSYFVNETIIEPLKVTMRKFLALWCMLVVAAVEAVPKMVCYYPNWAYYRKGTGKFTTDNIDVSLCTHVIYAFVVLDPSSYTMKTHDSWLDLELGNYDKAVALKKKNPSLKVLVALGGWTDSQSNKYSAMVASPSSIVTFADSALAFLQKYGFDGLDLDWEYPGAADKANFAHLVQTLRRKMGNRYQLTMAVSANAATIDSAYDVPVLDANLDAIHLMTYDMHGTWEKKADSHAPLYKRPWEPEGNSVAYTVEYWISKGASPSKLVLGIPTYGRSWKLADLYAVNPPNALATGPGARGPGTGEDGFLAYWEICNNIQAGGWTVVRDPSGCAGPYAYSSSTLNWVGYDDIDIVTKKARYAKGKKLGGCMVWDLSMDDFSDLCGYGQNPLMSAIVAALNSDISINASAPEYHVAPSVVPIAKPELRIVTPSKTWTKFVCPGDGLYAVPGDCSVFYSCYNGAAIVMNCGPGTLFNPKLKVCDWPSNVHCH